MSPWFELSAETSDARFAAEETSSVPVIFCDSRIIERLASGSIVRLDMASSKQSDEEVVVVVGCLRGSTAEQVPHNDDESLIMSL